MEQPAIYMPQLLVSKFTILEVEEYNLKDSNLSNTLVCLSLTISIVL